jgi:two-component system cell cycle sensor histidine kinase/response regulator CckA
MTDSNAKSTILLAEDEPAIRNLVGFALERKGYSVLAASNGEEAVKLSRQYPGTIDLLLSDVRMPKMDGLQAAQVIQHERPDIRVLLMTGESSCGVPPQLEAALIRKPFLPMVLLEKVRVLLSHNRPHSREASRIGMPLY